ncbi:MAG: hypothetical protein ACREUU_11645, partial [Gammaproteobacteria bacterium]
VLSMAELARLSDDANHRETPVMYEARLAGECIANADRYFQRQIVTRLDRELLEYSRELLQETGDIRTATKTGDKRKRPSSCYEHKRYCEYLGLCTGCEETTNDKWVTKERTDEQRKRVSTSRIRAWQKCHRYHYYRYDQGIEERDPGEARQFGILWDIVASAWWSASVN